MDAEGILWRVAQKDQAPHRRIAAAAAQARLIRRRLLRRPWAKEVLNLICDESLDIFARRELLDAAGYLERGAPDPELVATLRTVAIEGLPVDPRAAQEENWPDLSPVALGALARLGILATDNELISNLLGLAPSREGWTFPKGAAGRSSASLAIGMMYADDSDAFAPAVAALIRECDWLALSRLVPHFRHERSGTPAIVIEALVERIHRVQTGRTAEPELFSLLAHLSPDRLARERWE